MERSQPDDLLTVKEAAALLKVSTVTITRYLKSGRLPAYQVGPRNLRIRRSDLHQLLMPAGRKEVESMQEQRSHVPLTSQEVRQQEAALSQAGKLRDRILVRRAGEELPSSAELIAKARQERSANL